MAVARLTCAEEAYPAKLAALARPPALWVAGRPEALSAPLVAIVGSRAACETGLKLAGELGAWLSERGIGVVSGLALGVDGAAHRGCLEGPSPTVAVLGGGLRRLSPASHRPLAREIVRAGGAVCSEQELDAETRSWMLVRRNHTICALAGAVVVIESGADGGTMHTARFAIELGRPLWVPSEGAGEGGRLLLEADAAQLRRASRQLQGLRVEGGPFARPFGDPRELASELAVLLAERG